MGSRNSKKTIFQEEVDKVFKVLSNEIYSGKKLPRERLVENNLSKTFEVSRMVIRQVLNNLETVGLVEIEPYKGATVSEITIERIVGAYEIAAGLEGFSIKLATKNITKEDLEKLEKNIHDQTRVNKEDYQKWNNLNKDFHRIINLRSGNRKLRALIKEHVQFTNYWFFFFAISGLELNIEQHKMILKALIEKDSEKARRCMEEHILLASDSIIKQMEKNVPIGVFRYA